jgi:uncharacterized membrane protein (Fun14 family)
LYGDLKKDDDNEYRYFNFYVCFYWWWVLWRLLIGYALKKVIKMLAIVVGLFLAGLAFLQYQQIASIYWHKVEGAITKLASATNSTIHDNSNIAALAMMSNFGIPLTSSMSVRFTIGFMRG